MFNTSDKRKSVLHASSATQNTKKRHSWAGRFGKTLLTATAALLMLNMPARAQWLNYGNHHDGTPGSGTIYTNTLNLEVQSYTSTSTSTMVGTTTVYTVSVTVWCNATTNPGFAAGDRIMIVDLDASPTGRNYDLATVTSTAIVSGYLHIYADAAITNNNVPHVATGFTKTHTQVMKVPQWSNVTLNTGDKITCLPWNGHTGGILAFCCDGTLTFNGGTIDASGQGVPGIPAPAVGASVSNTSSTPGTYSATPGGDGGSASGSLLGHYFNGNLGIDVTSSCTPHHGGHGGCGDGAIDGTGPFPGGRSITFNNAVGAIGIFLLEMPGMPDLQARTQALVEREVREVPGWHH